MDILTSNTMLARGIDPHAIVVTSNPRTTTSATAVPNKSLRTIDTELSALFPSPHLAFGKRCSAATWRDELVDASAMDLLHIIDRLRCQHYDYTRRIEPAMQHVRGVMLHCRGDHKLCGRAHPRVEEVYAARSVCDGAGDAVLKIGAGVEIPLVVHKVGVSLAWRDRAVIMGMPNVYNPIAAKLLGAWNHPTFHAKMPEPVLQAMVQEVSAVGSWRVMRRDGETIDRRLCRGWWSI
jgi:hypothetical protein